MMGEFAAYDYSCWCSAISGMISIIHQAIPWNVRPVVVEKWKKCRSLGWRDKSSRLDVLVELEPLWISLEIWNDFHSHLTFNYWMLYHGLIHRKINPWCIFCVTTSQLRKLQESRPNCLRKSPYHHLRSVRLRHVRDGGWMMEIVCESCEVYPTEDSHVLPQKRDQFKKEVNHHPPTMGFSGDMLVFRGASMGFPVENSSVGEVQSNWLRLAERCTVSGPRFFWFQVVQHWILWHHQI